MNNDLTSTVEGDEVLATIFSMDHEEMMLLAMGAVLGSGGLKRYAVHLYRCLDGEVENGIDTYCFRTEQERQQFLNELPTMSAMELIIKGVGIMPMVSE